MDPLIKYMRTYASPCYKIFRKGCIRKLNICTFKKIWRTSLLFMIAEKTLFAILHYYVMSSFLSLLQFKVLFFHMGNVKNPVEYSFQEFYCEQ